MKYIRIFDIMEECITYETALNLRAYCKLYEDSFDEITDYAELGFSAVG